MSLKHVFGPVPSRRFGRSLGINNIPPKQCTYSCVYCQLGRSLNIRSERRTYFLPETLYSEAARAVEFAAKNGDTVDYLTLVPDGEPTLDINIGETIGRLGDLGIPVAVITNASLLWRKDVRDDLMGAGVVSVKVDATHPEVWHKINRGHGRLRFDRLIEGIMDFSNEYGGELITETMLVKDINDTTDNLNWNAEFIRSLKPKAAYIAIVTRPPAEEWVCAPDEATVNQAYQIYNSSIDRVEYLIGYEGNEFGGSGNVEENLLNITAVHPMREDAVREYVSKREAGMGIVNKLLEDGKLIRTKYGEHYFYLRKLPHTRIKI